MEEDKKDVAVNNRDNTMDIIMDRIGKILMGNEDDERAGKLVYVTYKPLRLKMRAFLEAFILMGTLTAAARALKMHISCHYDWMELHTEYVEAFQDAQIERNENIESEIIRRGRDGVLEPVFYKDKQIATIRKFSDNLLMFHAKGTMPEKYRDNVSVNVSGDLTIKTASMSDQDKLDLIKSVAAKAITDAAVDTTYSVLDDSDDSNKEDKP